MEADERAEEARRAKEAGNDAYRKSFLETAVEHYTRGARLDPRDISFLTNRAAAYFRMGKYKECVRDCDEAVKRGRDLSADNKLIAKALSRKASALLELAACSGDYAPAIRALLLKEMLGNFQSENDLLKFRKATEQATILKKEASDERLKRIESERMARTMEEYLSGVQQESERLKKQHDEVMDRLRKANMDNEHLQGQLSESRGQYEWILSEHDRLLRERNHAVREVEELRQKRGQMLSVLVTAMHCEFSASELEHATENFSSSLKIGEGGFGCVYKGTLRNMTVAIKVLKPDGLQGQSQFEQEVAILSRVRHPHLVTLLGACSDISTLVYEFLPNGSLEDFLMCAEKRQSLPWQIRVRIISEICSALTFLHKNKPHPVVHGDLKPANILLDVNLVSKLSDFGISRHLIQSSTMHPMGTLQYMDPEFFATGELTCQSDIYSFGIVVLRLLTGKPPDGIKKIVEDAMEKGDLNSVVDTSAGEWPAVHVQQLALLALSCTELSRKCRPDLSAVVWAVVEAMKDAATVPSASSSRSVSNENSTPSYFICPISQDVMDDPHIAADGFTYEAEAIRSWIDSGHDTSPMTNMRLEHDELIPNRTLRSAIQEWLQQQNTAL